MAKRMHKSEDIEDTNLDHEDLEERDERGRFTNEGNTSTSRDEDDEDMDMDTETHPAAPAKKK